MPALMLPGWRDLFQGLLHLVYPNLCAGCEAAMPTQQSCFCFACQRRLEVTNMYLSPENEFTDRFWGRLPLVSGAALYYFHRKSPIQHALHRLKYKHQADIGVRIGRYFGYLLANSPSFKHVEALVPVPLHPQKERLRGYNQSAMFANGLAESLNIPVLPNALQRQRASDTQTRKKRMERFENVQEVFTLRHPDRVRGRHLLLVDDVLTTGATLEACGSALLQAPEVQLSMATIAIAMR